MTSSTTSVGIADTVASSVRAALRAGITTITLACAARTGLALGVDYPRPAPRLGLGLTGDRMLHRLGDLDVLDLDRRDLDPPRLGVGVDHVLQLLVQSLALGQQRVQVRAAEHRAECGLGD